MYRPDRDVEKCVGRIETFGGPSKQTKRRRDLTSRTKKPVAKRFGSDLLHAHVGDSVGG